MSINTMLLIINAVILFGIFVKVDHVIKRMEEMEEFMKLVCKQFWRRG